MSYLYLLSLLEQWSEQSQSACWPYQGAQGPSSWLLGLLCSKMVYCQDHYTVCCTVYNKCYHTFTVLPIWRKVPSHWSWMSDVDCWDNFYFYSFYCNTVYWAAVWWQWCLWCHHAATIINNQLSNCFYYLLVNLMQWHIPSVFSFLSPDLQWLLPQFSR